MITPDFPPRIGGISLYVFNLSQKLVDRGHRVTIITQGNGKKEFEQTGGIKIYRTYYSNRLRPFHIHFHAIFVNKLLKSIENDLDILHAHLPGAPPIFTSLRVAVTVHTLTLAGWTKYPVINSMKKAVAFNLVFPLDRMVLERADLVTAVSDTVSRELLEYHECESEVIGNAVDTEFFLPKQIKDDSLTVLFCGRLILEKGIIDLAKAAKYVCNKHPSVSFVLAGSGPFKSEMEREIRREGISENFTLLGEIGREKLLWHYQNSTIFVLPSYYESFPNVILEAMSCGLPIVTTKVCDMPKIIRNGKNGVLVPPGNPSALAEAILVLLEDPDLRKKMGKASRERSEAFYSLDKLADKMIDYYTLLQPR